MSLQIALRLGHNFGFLFDPSCPCLLCICISLFMPNFWCARPPLGMVGATLGLGLISNARSNIELHHPFGSHFLF